MSKCLLRYCVLAFVAYSVGFVLLYFWIQNDWWHDRLDGITAFAWGVPAALVAYAIQVRFVTVRRLDRLIDRAEPRFVDLHKLTRQQLSWMTRPESPDQPNQAYTTETFKSIRKQSVQLERIHGEVTQIISNRDRTEALRHLVGWLRHYIEETEKIEKENQWQAGGYEGHLQTLRKLAEDAASVERVIHPLYS